MKPYSTWCYSDTYSATMLIAFITIMGITQRSISPLVDFDSINDKLLFCIGQAIIMVGYEVIMICKGKKNICNYTPKTPHYLLYSPNTRYKTVNIVMNALTVNRRRLATMIVYIPICIYISIQMIFDPYNNSYNMVWFAHAKLTLFRLTWILSTIALMTYSLSPSERKNLLGILCFTFLEIVLLVLYIGYSFGLGGLSRIISISPDEGLVMPLLVRDIMYVFWVITTKSLQSNKWNTVCHISHIIPPYQVNVVISVFQLLVVSINVFYLISTGQNIIVWDYPTNYISIIFKMIYQACFISFITQHCNTMDGVLFFMHMDSFICMIHNIQSSSDYSHIVDNTASCCIIFYSLYHIYMYDRPTIKNNVHRSYNDYDGKEMLFNEMPMNLRTRSTNFTTVCNRKYT